MSKEKILIVDDDPEIRELIATYLKKEDMNISQADNGQKALQMIKNNSFDLVLLDIMMEGIDGFEVLKKIRMQDQHLHVMILSAREEDHDKVLGLGLGADDYITKPFSPNELIARIKSQLRRNKINKDSDDGLIVSGAFKLDLKAYKLTKNDTVLELSARELKLFRFFIENPDRVYTKKQIYENVWEDGYFDDNSLMVYIRHLREKIEDNPNKPEYIRTVWGIGYKYSLKETEQ
jgi:two-component system, OmpR family, phosphate regulon response regulator OmpR